MLVKCGGALVWCPSSNEFLLGTTADVSLAAAAHRVALGTDSRLSGERDLLSEMRFAAGTNHVNAAGLLRMVTVDAASILRLADAGALRPGAPADVVIFPMCSKDPGESILATDRSKIRLVLIGGRALVGDVDMLPVFAATGIREAAVCVDRQGKLMAQWLADKMKSCRAHEAGLEL
jgi:cytosine/adenosine deaminase-related metal-dependent hydrolase